MVIVTGSIDIETKGTRGRRGECIDNLQHDEIGGDASEPTESSIIPTLEETASYAAEAGEEQGNKTNESQSGTGDSKNTPRKSPSHSSKRGAERDTLEDRTVVPPKRAKYHHAAGNTLSEKSLAESDVQEICQNTGVEHATYGKDASKENMGTKGSKDIVVHNKGYSAASKLGQPARRKRATKKVLILRYGEFPREIFQVIKIFCGPGVFLVNPVRTSDAQLSINDDSFSGLSSVEVAFVPIQHKSHWTLGVIKKNQIHYYESLPELDSKDCCDRLLNLVKQHSAEEYQLVRKPVQNQQGSNSGIYVIANAIAEAVSLPLPSKILPDILRPIFKYMLSRANHDFAALQEDVGRITEKFFDLILSEKDKQAPLHDFKNTVEWMSAVLYRTRSRHKATIDRNTVFIRALQADKQKLHSMRMVAVTMTSDRAKAAIVENVYCQLQTVDQEIDEAPARVGTMNQSLIGMRLGTKGIRVYERALRDVKAKAEARVKALRRDSDRITSLLKEL